MNIRALIITAVLACSYFSLTTTSAHAQTTSRAPTYGRCVFPSSRILASTVSQELKAQYQKAGYTNVWVVVKVIEQRQPATQLTLRNIYGFQAAIPDPSNPTSVKIYANAGGVPIDIPCTTEVQISTQVYLTNPAGKQLQGTSTSTVVVEGAFN
jgi:hypothetical protein